MLTITFFISNEVKAQGMCYSVSNASLSITSGSYPRGDYVLVKNYNKNSIYVSCDVYGLNSDGDWEYIKALYNEKVSSGGRDKFFVCGENKYKNYKIKAINIKACTDDE